MSDMLEPKSERALVTGATKGIGAAVAKQLRVGGVTVLATARSRPRDLARGSLFVAADITTAEGVTSS
jgi:short-subunit dehydrogenase